MHIWKNENCIDKTDITILENWICPALNSIAYYLTIILILNLYILDDMLKQRNLTNTEKM